MLNDHPERHGAAHLAVSWTDSKAREAGGTEAVGPGRRLGSAFSRSVARRLPSAECEVSASLSTASSAVSHLPRGSPAAPDVPHSAPKVTIRERARPVTPPRRHAGEDVDAGSPIPTCGSRTSSDLLWWHHDRRATDLNLPRGSLNRARAPRDRRSGALFKGRRGALLKASRAPPANRPA